MEVIDALTANGDTPGSGAIRTAYFLAKSNFSKDFNNRVILATDGDFNVGQKTDDELENLIVSERQTGISLTCLGVGMGNFKDSKLEILSKQGNGNYAYLDNVNEAEKVLVTEFTKTLYNVAEEAYLNIVFNPDYVSKYRLIGFDNPRDIMADTSNKIQGGEVGSGHSMMAMFQFRPTNKNAVDIQNQNFATLNLQYKLPKTREQIKQSFGIPYAPKNLMAVDSVYRFATSIAMFGSILRGSKYMSGFGFESVMQLALSAVNTANVSQKEFLDIVDKADEIYNHRKKKKK
jgi:Ca-activated chloride channel family protein